MIPFPSNPLFSSFVTLYTLLLLYFPAFFLKLLFSPVLISAGILLLSLLRQGAAQKGNGNLVAKQAKTETETATASNTPHSKRSISHSEHGPGPTPHRDPVSVGSFVEWDVGSPLEVIHEAYCEGEEEGEAADGVVSRQIPVIENNGECRFGSVIERYPSLSRYYPETDSDSESDSGCLVEGDFPAIDEFERSPQKVCFRWEDEDGLIEIELDGDCGKGKVIQGLEFQVEEDNLIEIDISPAGER